MPNWVTTVVEFSGADQDIRAVLANISSEDTKFDFNKLIPMPESLKVDAGSTSDLAYAYYYIKTLNRLPERSYYKDNNEVVKRVEENKSLSTEEMLEFGKILYDNKEKYGATTWYDWCCGKWGTKWNACDAEVTCNTLIFNTAWSFADPVMQKLAELCSNHRVSFEGVWADEDLGNNAGEFESPGDGCFYYDYYDSCSSEAYSAYIRCNGESKCIGVGNDGGYYRYQCEEASCPHYKECTVAEMHSLLKKTRS